jgi:hypothetical protein
MAWVTAGCSHVKSRGSINTGVEHALGIQTFLGGDQRLGEQVDAGGQVPAPVVAAHRMVMGDRATELVEHLGGGALGPGLLYQRGLSPSACQEK